MPKRPVKAGAAVTLADANNRISELRTRGVPTRMQPEDLTAPLDADIRVTPQSYSNGDAHQVALYVDGEAVSWLTVVDYSQQVGRSQLRMGGIAGVGTHDAHRFRGYSRRVIDNALRYMRAAGFDVSMLFGIRSFYPKFGFAEAFPDTSFTIATRDAEADGAVPAPPARDRVRWVDFDPRAHLAFVVKAHAQHNAGLTGPVHRDLRRWSAFRKGLQFGTQATARVAIDGNNRPRAYLACHREHLAAIVLEAGAGDIADLRHVLHEAARIALEQRLEQVRFVLPHDHVLTRLAMARGIRVETTYRADGGAMIRLIDPVSTLTKLAPVLGERASVAGRKVGSLTLHTNLGTIGLAWRDGTLSVTPGRAGGAAAKLPQWALAQLVYGYRDAESLAAQGVVRAPRAAVESLGVLFPPQSQFFYAADQF